MRSFKKILSWRLVFALCALAYVPWVVWLSLDNFDMVHSDYRRAGERLQPERIEATARRELVDQCRKAAGQELPPTAAEDPCLSWPAAALAERQGQVRERLAHQRRLAGRKLVLFYGSFGVFFLILPLLLLSLLLALASWVYRNVKIVKQR